MKKPRLTNNFIYLTFCERIIPFVEKGQNYRDRKQINWSWGKGSLQRGQEGIFWGDGTILHIDCGDGYTTVCISQKS